MYKEIGGEIIIIFKSLKQETFLVVLVLGYALVDHSAWLNQGLLDLDGLNSQKYLRQT